jgi:DMSO reductase anchor subunit
VKPALSVVAFTVLSGAGLGALVLFALADVIAATGRLLFDRELLLRGAALALVLVIAGLLSSVLHLGNPRNAWKSLARWRTSWLSREAASALLLLGCAAAWVFLLASNGDARVRAAVAIAVMLLSWSTLYCTAMIYASLKPIRQWNTRRVPATYAILAHASGALLVVALLRASGAAASGFAATTGVLLFLAACIKLEYYAYIASDVRRLTLEQALGVAEGVRPPGTDASRMRARLLDVGHSRGTFLTREFVYTLEPAQRTFLRLVFWIAGLVIPASWLVLGLDTPAAAVLVVVACLVGIGAERWLFFAEARHTVRLYHGDRAT